MAEKITTSCPGCQKPIVIVGAVCDACNEKDPQLAKDLQNKVNAEKQRQAGMRNLSDMVSPVARALPPQDSSASGFEAMRDRFSITKSELEGYGELCAAGEKLKAFSVESQELTDEGWPAKLEALIKDGHEVDKSVLIHVQELMASLRQRETKAESSLAESKLTCKKVCDALDKAILERDAFHSAFDVAEAKVKAMQDNLDRMLHRDRSEPSAVDEWQKRFIEENTFRKLAEKEHVDLLNRFAKANSYTDELHTYLISAGFTGGNSQPPQRLAYEVIDSLRTELRQFRDLRKLLDKEGLKAGELLAEREHLMAKRDHLMEYVAKLEAITRKLDDKVLGLELSLKSANNEIEHLSELAKAGDKKDLENLEKIQDLNKQISDWINREGRLLAEIKRLKIMEDAEGPKTPYLYVDTARFGDQKSKVYVVNPGLPVEVLEAPGGIDLVALVEFVFNVSRWRQGTVWVDTSCLGAGTYDMLKEKWASPQFVKAWRRGSRNHLGEKILYPKEVSQALEARVVSDDSKA